MSSSRQPLSLSLSPLGGSNPALDNPSRLIDDQHRGTCSRPLVGRGSVITGCRRWPAGAPASVRCTAPSSGSTRPLSAMHAHYQPSPRLTPRSFPQRPRPRERARAPSVRILPGWRRCLCRWAPSRWSISEWSCSGRRPRRLTTRSSEQRLAVSSSVYHAVFSPASVAELESVRRLTSFLCPKAHQNRDLTDAERSLVRWMLERGGLHAQDFLTQLNHAQVTPWRCQCGCASLHFSVVGQPEPDPGSSMHPLADGIFGEESNQNALFVYERCGVLAGLEVYGLSGDASRTLPTPDSVCMVPPETPVT